MAQDLLRTLRELQNTAIGNCRKRIDEAARRARRRHESEDRDVDGKPTGHDVTSQLREKYGL